MSLRSRSWAWPPLTQSISVQSRSSWDRDKVPASFTPVPLSPEKHITFMLELLVSRRWLQCRDRSIGGAGPPLPLFSAYPSFAQGNRIARARCLPQPPPCAAACVLPLWHCRIAPCAMQLERALPTEEARRSSWNAGTLLSALVGIKTLGFSFIFVLFCLRWLTVSS